MEFGRIMFLAILGFAAPSATRSSSEMIYFQSIEKDVSAGRVNDLFVSDDGQRFAYTQEITSPPLEADQSQKTRLPSDQMATLVMGEVGRKSVPRTIANVSGKTQVLFMGPNACFYSSDLDATVVTENGPLKVPQDGWKDPWLRPKLAFHDASNLLLVGFEMPDLFEIDPPVRGSLVRFGLSDFKRKSTAAKDLWNFDAGSIVALRISPSGSEASYLTATRHRRISRDLSEPDWDFQINALQTSNGERQWSRDLPSNLFSVSSISSFENDRVTILGMMSVKGKLLPTVLDSTTRGVREWRPDPGVILDHAEDRALVHTDARELLIVKTRDGSRLPVCGSFDSKSGMKAVLSSNGRHAFMLSEMKKELELRIFSLN